MTIKLIALDMDGTLLNRQKLVPEKNALAIKKAMDKGIYVTIATGRMPASASYFAKQLNMNCPVVSCNGGVGLIQVWIKIGMPFVMPPFIPAL